LSKNAKLNFQTSGPRN